MVTHLKIVTEENTHIHFDFKVGGQNYTLCGLETGGDVTLGIRMSEPVLHKRINCPRCISIVKFCKSIKRTEYR
jgi:hypothetical protein